MKEGAGRQINRITRHFETRDCSPRHYEYFSGALHACGLNRKQGRHLFDMRGLEATQVIPLLLFLDIYCILQLSPLRPRPQRECHGGIAVSPFSFSTRAGQVNHKLVYRLYIEEGLQVRTKTPKRERRF